jgi:hypothetical protein
MDYRELSKKYSISGDAAQLFNTIIDECVFAFLMSYEGKINPLIVKEMLMDHFNLNDHEFYYDPNQDLSE